MIFSNCRRQSYSLHWLFGFINELLMGGVQMKIIRDLHRLHTKVVLKSRRENDSTIKNPGELNLKKKTEI
jgi:hypothetical protein